MKAQLKRFLRNCSAQWINSIESEPIVGLLNDYWHKTYDCLNYGIEKGWIIKVIDSRRTFYYFTEKGRVEILNDLKNTTCISGRIVE